MKKLVLFFTIISLFVSQSVFAQTVPFLFRIGPDTQKIYEVDGGDKIDGNVFISLEEEVDASFEISFTSVSNNPLAKEGSGTILDLSSWISYPEGNNIFIEGTHPGKQEIKIPFVITVPEEISPGDYRGIMKARYIMGSSEVENVGVSFTTALGEYFRFSVPGERVHLLDFIDLEFGGFVPKEEDEKEEAVKLNVVYQNLGNSLLRPSVNVLAKDIFDNVVYENSFTFKDIFPETGEASKSIVLEKLESFIGWRDIEVKLYYGLVNVDGSIEGDLFESGLASIRVYVIPWLEILIGLIAVLFLLFIIFYKRFKIKSLRASSKMYLVKKGDTLQSVCEKFNVNPAHVIIANKLKRPYFLKPGEKIYIPKK
ncbi:LysM peptidoglycan-binding domain-containing protein [Candidatus Peregrinibacteria bacterium]|nr:LysM peptidoglycan-binding domain-containing protein [Candidatus Peregrinibacteria bacterium]